MRWGVGPVCLWTLLLPKSLRHQQQKRGTLLVVLAVCSQNRTYMIVSVTRIYTLVKNGDSGPALLHSLKTPKEQGVQGGEGEGSWEEERERGCGVHASRGSSQKATGLSGGLGVVSPWGGVSAPLLAGRAKSPSGSQAPGCGWAVSPGMNDSAWLGPVKPCALTLSFTAFSCVRECLFLFVFMKVVKSSPCGLSSNRQGPGLARGQCSSAPGEGQMALEVPASLPLRLCLQVFGRAAWPHLPPADGPAEPGARRDPPVRLPGPGPALRQVSPVQDTGHFQLPGVPGAHAGY